MKIRDIISSGKWRFGILSLQKNGDSGYYTFGKIGFGIGIWEIRIRDNIPSGNMVSGNHLTLPISQNFLKIGNGKYSNISGTEDMIELPSDIILFEGNL